jgi:mannan endo-1,4-beta-mannosidase
MKKILSLLILLFANVWIFGQTTTRIEAESGTLTNGSAKVTDATCSGGAYVATNTGDISISVTMTADTYFDMYVYVAAPNGDKTQNFVIDANSSTFSLTNNASYIRLKVATFVKLATGTHTIKITNNWGWINVDYIEMTSIDPATRFNTSANLVTPSPTAGTNCVYSFLKNNYGNHIISGVMTLDVLNGSAALPLYSQAEVNYLYTQTGKYPALVGFDFMHATGLNTDQQWYKDYTNATVTMATELWNKGGIPEFTWHWKDPTKNDASFYATGSTPTSFKLSSAFTTTACTTWNTSSTAYKAIIADIDIVAGYLKQLQTNGVTVIWRPLHEAAGGWFWWGASGSTACKNLYQLEFDRLVNFNGLKNLIWVWTYEPSEDGTWYPGDSYVDIVGRDIYKDGDHTSQILEFNNINALHNTKMVTLSECGSFPAVTNLTNDGAAWSWFMPWYGNYTTSATYNTVALWKEIMTSSYGITLDEMPGWANYCGTNAAPTVSITLPATNATFTAPATVTINATATDADGTVTKVDFYNGSTLLGSDAISPYSYSWTGVTAGTDTLKAIATDNKGATTTSSLIIITVQKTQTIALTAGWNLISFNVQPTDSNVTTVFAGLGTNLLTVKTADAFYAPSQTAAYNSLVKIKRGDAYLVKVTSAQSLSVTGTLLKTNAYALKTGWNMVGFPQQASASIATSTTGITTQFVSTKNFDGFYVKGGTANSLTNFDPGKGYFLKVSAATAISW